MFLLACVYVYMYVPGVEKAKGHQISQELGIQTVVCHRVSAGSRTQVLCKSKECS